MGALNRGISYIVSHGRRSRAGPVRKTREHACIGDGMWCGMLHAPSPENLLHDLLTRTFTAMHCYVKSHAFEVQRLTGREPLKKLYSFIYEESCFLRIKCKKLIMVKVKYSNSLNKLHDIR